MSIKSFEEDIKTAFKGDILGRKVIFVSSTDSTNDLAMKLGEESDEPEGIIVVSDSQTAGRGRMGRSWISPSGVNLYFTALLKPGFPTIEAPLLTLTAAVACVSAIRDLTGINAEIKWPNDLLVNNRKTGGILLDMKTYKDNIKFVAVGIGINVNMDPVIFPEDIKPYSTSLAKECGRTIDRVELFKKILSELEQSYKSLLSGGKVAMLQQWRLFSSTLGKNVSVKMYDKVISGIAEDIDGTGALVIKLPSGGHEVVNAGDVTVLKKS
ncbi:MAG: biotin--[acetyl-CoA-carboxylase] ligase [Thermodesulfovibrionia bacterium]|nr:biotin--[acetyl-CoA-carboxylase] ligase [Thermodesulfovibrionia bacterium]